MKPSNEHFSNTCWFWVPSCCRSPPLPPSIKTSLARYTFSWVGERCGSGVELMELRCLWGTEFLCGHFLGQTLIINDMCEFTGWLTPLQVVHGLSSFFLPIGKLREASQKIQMSAHSWGCEGKASTETSSLILSLRSHSEYFPGIQWRKRVWATADLLFCVLRQVKSGCPGPPVTTAHMGMVLCLVLASEAALTSHFSWRFYTLFLLLSNVTD